MSHQKSLRAGEDDDESGFKLEQLAFGQRVGLKTDSLESSVLEEALKALTDVVKTDDLTSVLNGLFKVSVGSGDDGDDDDGPSYGYDPSVKWLAGFAMTYGVLTLQVLLVDGAFYGVLIKVGKKEEDDDGGDDDGGDEKKNGGKKSARALVAAGKKEGDDNGDGEDDGPFAGLELEIIYRKINDHLGEFSADLTLPDKFRKLKLGAASLTLPVIGVNIWTNGDFKVSIGWPLGDRSFNIEFPPDPIPWAGGGGLYFAKLRSEDSPDLPQGFNPIIEFGIALRIGAATEGDFSVVSYAASLYLFGSFQGFLAWREGHSFSDGVDYYWFCATVGITGHLEGSVDFVVISVSVSLDVTASVSMALETAHATVAVAEFTAEVEASIKILFFRIHFSFSLDVKVQVTFGSGPPAQITGPTPPGSLAFEAHVRNAALLEEAEPAAALYVTQVTQVSFSAPAPVAVSLHFLLQPSIRYDAAGQKWVPIGVASLVVDRTAPTGGNGSAVGLGGDSFSLLVGSLASFLLATYGNYTDPTQNITKANLDALSAALDAGQFNLQAVYNWLNGGNVTFTVTGVTTGTGDTSAAVFPVIPGMVLGYNGQSTPFGDATPPADYLTALKNYFAKLSMVGDGRINESAHALLAAAAQPPPASWFPGVVFADYFGIIAKQLYQGLADLKTQGTLANALTQIDVGNLAGTATRFLQHGLRVPDPADVGGSLETMPLRGLYDLSGQQFDVTGGNTPVLTATLGGQAKVQVSFAGGPPTPTSVTSSLPFALTAQPAQSPLWNPQPLERIRNVPLSFMLRQGVAWGEQVGASQTKQWLMYGFPDPLQSQLRLQPSLKLAVSTTDGNAPPQPAPGLTGLLIRFSLSLIPQLNPPGAALDYVFQVAGTDDETRDLMELLFDSGALPDMGVELLLPAGAAGSGAGYKTSTADNSNTLLLKTNLSTYNQPNLMAFFSARAAESTPPLPPLGPTSALITDTTNFLRLLWECSVVHGGGFFLYVPDLKASDFGSQQQMDVALMVKSKSAPPAQSVAVTNYNNVILLQAAGITPSARVQADVFQPDGKTPVTQPQPNYPAGTLAFGAVWNNAPSEATAGNTSDYASTLYQLLQFQLAPGDRIDGSGWSMPLGPDGDAGTWVYKRAVPVYRFVQGASDPPNRYGAVGIQATVNLALEDVFGNAAALNPLKLAAVYNDPLIPFDQWPGTSIVFAFGAAAGGNASLTLTATFDPTQVTQPQTALPFYQSIYDQLTDPRVGVAVTTALAAGAVALKTAGGDDTRTALSKFAGAIIAYLSAGGHGTAPAAFNLAGVVPIGYVSQIDEDLFPVWVSATTTRTAPQENVTYDYPPGFLSVTTQIPPLLNAAGNTDPAALRQWAVGFEKAFVNFDASGTLLKVLAGSPPSKVLATASKLGLTAAGSVTSAPGDLWALKWGAESGVAVVFGNTAPQPTPAQQPVYFAPLPLSTELISATVPVSSYDAGSGQPTGSTPTTFSGVDMDGLARSFLQSVDGLLTPSLATAIARLDAVQYNKLMTAKEGLAYAISSDISWVFKDQMPVPGGQPGAGDITSAQVRFRENLLASLGSDFATSVIVQMPAAVSVKNPFESGQSSKAPELFGNPSPAQSTSKTTLNQYTISTATLPVTAGTGHLNFLVGAVNPTTQSDLCLDFAYDINFLDHQFQTSEEQFGYTPSSWLRFVVPDIDPTGKTPPVLDVSMGQLDIPVPLRAYPSPPRLVTQAAVASVPGATTITDALLADYQLQVARPRVAQDDLHLSVEFNGADFSLKAATDSGAQLFATLANFQNFQTQYLQTATDAITHNSAAAAQWLKDIVQLVQAVSDAWQAEAPSPNALGAEADAPQIPAPYTWDFMLQVPDESHPNVMLLAWAGAGAPPAGAWPTIETAAGQPTQQPNVMQYTLPAGSNVDEPTLTWPKLSVITVQSVSSTAWIVRNETLAGCGGQTQARQTNPDFVYSTATVTFASAVIPLLEVPGMLTIQAASVDDAVGQLVTQVMTPTSPVSQVGWALQVEYSFVLVSGQNGQLQTKLPVFLARTDVTTAAQPPAGVETAQQIADALRGALKSWYGDFHPSDTGASLLFALTVFAANSQQPLARLFDIEAPISGAGWWNPPKPKDGEKSARPRPKPRPLPAD